MYDQGKEFFGHVFKNDPIKDNYVINDNCATTENPQNKSILERIHQFITNLVRTNDLQNNYLDEDDPWLGLLETTGFVV